VLARQLSGELHPWSQSAMKESTETGNRKDKKKHLRVNPMKKKKAKLE